MSLAQRHMLAGNPKTSMKTLRQLAYHTDPAVRERLAENSNTPADVLQKLLQDPNPEVRIALAFNPSVSESMLMVLCSDEDVNVRLALAEGMELPDAVLSRLAEDENPYVRDRAESTLEIKALEQNLRAQNFVAERGTDAKLGDLLCKAGRLDEQRLIRLLRASASEQRPLGHIVLRDTDLPAAVIVTALKVQSRIRRGTLSLSDGITMLKNVAPADIPADKSSTSSKTLQIALENLGQNRRHRGQGHLPQAAQYAMAQVLDNSNSLSDAAPELLRTICESVSFDVGIIWQVSPDRGRLVMVDVWHVPSRPVPNFEPESRLSQFAPGVGLPGSVWQLGASAWISDLMSDASFPRSTSAQLDGLVTGFAFPIKIQGNVTGVLEFYSRTRREPDSAMLEFFYSAASQIGQFIERKEAQSRLRELQAITTAVGDALVQSATLGELLHDCAEAMVTYLNATFARIWTLDHTGQYLLLQASAGLYTHLNGSHGRIKVGQLKVGLIASEMTPHFTNDVENDPRVSNKEWAKKEGIVAFAGHPLMVEGKLVGVMAMFAREPLTRETMAALSSIADQIAIGIQRKHAEHMTQKALQSEQRIAQAIIDRAPSGIARLDANLVITSMNSQFAQLFGGQEIISQRLLGRFIFQALPGFPVEKLMETVQNRVPFHLNEYSVSSSRDRAGSGRYWDIAGWPVETEEGGMILMATEVTDRVRLAHQRDDFVATLTHDLKNPIIGAIRVLSCFTDGRIGDLDEKQASILKELVGAQEGMLRLISNLLEVYRYDGGHADLKFRTVDLKLLAESAIQELSTTNKDCGVNLESVFVEPDNHVLGDSTALRRVLTNLLSNAVKFTGSGGTVTVSGRSVERSYVVEVKDTGPGISQQEQERLFERFSQGGLGRQNESGTGLGLYLSRQIVERHGGTITCESELGQGATFRIILPLETESGGTLSKE